MRALARACRLLDERDPCSFELLKRIFTHEGRAYVVGVTGTPGAGKSTLVDGLIRLYREQGKRVAVLAIDPTSPYSGGAILGDRIRMQQHFTDDGVFIRSIATRGHLGGLSRSTGDVLHVLHASTFDVVIVETVGVGQDELEVTQLADTTLVVMAPGLGDDIQAIKAGILEVADVFAVNKSDRAGADATVQDLQQMLSLRRAPTGVSKMQGHTAVSTLRQAPEAEADEWLPPILKTVAHRQEGLADLVDAFSRHHEFLTATEAGQAIQAQRQVAEFRAILYQALIDEVDVRFAEQVSEKLRDIVDGQADPYSSAEALVRSALGANEP
ncbi:MAG: methylmalonyl Co-A mutase-associated GTPase MeaB [Deltaproteobacteria bacterium]|nr:methylmalonyl Co-A mutase-associated GTPase MeaB [Deltaproteobacteria bacterium]NND27471.1 methylmalonyl Co-A mutase-associated GTPase MeaB [Myxococcales bacterium]MBT8465449.1 methylmalonyl Co-A mutase-associated GTPase MeaB [Deltaproteobacteria bacterium]MBT8482028.1 methylmalonyl Co-A mutase-associated GTPase MeaB [Deltaproteobacteria bacterium]NNK07551.1 methylmalonyl Co-A mutase-associated GTPase MeaB [Myxococcales bacterium]